MNYDIVYITHLPSFYKNNLFNEIKKVKNILVIFIGKYSTQRNNDFIDTKLDFDYIYLQECEFEMVKKIKSIKYMLTILKSITFSKIIVGGWDMPHFWIALLYCKNFRKGIKTASIVESSSIESKLNFIKKSIKKIFCIFNDALIIAGGGSHRDLVTALNFKGDIFVAKGVGIPNIFYQDNSSPYHPKRNEFLYIGRISSEKNINLLIDVFENNTYDFKLNIIGGNLESSYKNIKSLNYIDNNSISTLIKNHIALILPSISEPWGLVIDEALICGVGVIVSSNVGSKDELVSPYNSGIIFKNNDRDSLLNTLIEFSKNYHIYHQNALKIDFRQRYQCMIKSYCLEASI